MSDQIVNNITPSQIYDGGTLHGISHEDLLNNPIAIKQLINDRNLVATENKDKANEIQNLKSEVEYLKTSPFISFISAILNIMSTVLVGIAINLITSEKANNYSTTNIIILACGIVCVFLGSAITILYPYARRWFNKASPVH